ncbi:hypothetical protein DUGA6_62670 [Duganella sp. HH105]|nr:hypothetical protein DUGA6_62670 [Duganella sp. HH105]
MHKRHAIRRGRRAFLEQRRHQRCRPVVARSVVPLHQQLVAFGGVQHIQILDAALRVGHDRLKQAGEVPRHAFDGRCVEQIRVVFKCATQAKCGLAQIQRQIELGTDTFDRHALHSQPWQCDRIARCILQNQHHLEQHRMAGMTLRPQRLDQPFKWQILVSVSIQRSAAHPIKQLQEARAVIHFRAQHQSVNEQTDQSLSLDPPAVGDRRADADVVLARVARQQHIEGRRQRHEQSAAALAAELRQRGRGIDRQHKRQRRPTLRLMRGARPVRRQLQQRRSAVQQGTPIIHLPRQGIAAQPVGLPVGVIGILYRQLRQRRRQTLRVRAVQRADLRHQHAHRPTIGNNMMQCQHDDVLGLAQAQQPRPHQGSVLQRERPARLLGDQIQCRRTAPGLRHVEQIDRFQRDRAFIGHHLHQLLSMHFEGGAQRIVPAHDLVEGCRQRRDIELALQAGANRQMVGGAARFKLIQEPHPLLRKRGGGQIYITFNRQCILDGCFAHITL